MYRKVLAALAASALLAGSANAALITSDTDPALDGSTVITFDDLPLGNSNVITTMGVTFTALGSGPLRIAAFNEGGTFGGSGQDLSTRDSQSNPDFRVDFSSPVSAFGMVWGAANPNWTATAYDSGGNVIDTQIFLGGNGGASFVEFYGIKAPNISYAIFDSSNDWLKVDNFEFVGGDTPRIPVPATLPLIAGGLAALGLLRRRR